MQHKLRPQWIHLAACMISVQLAGCVSKCPDIAASRRASASEELSSVVEVIPVGDLRQFRSPDFSFRLAHFGPVLLDSHGHVVTDEWLAEVLPAAVLSGSGEVVIVLSIPEEKLTSCQLLGEALGRILAPLGSNGVVRGRVRVRVSLGSFKREKKKEPEKPETGP